MSRSHLTQKQQFLCEVSVEKLAHSLGLGCSSACGLCLAPLPTLHVEQVAHEGGNLRGGTTYAFCGTR